MFRGVFSSSRYRLFRTSEYSWREHGYALANKFYPVSAELIEEEFDHIYNLTYSTFNNESVDFDTGPFRRAVWYYVLRLVVKFVGGKVCLHCW